MRVKRRPAVCASWSPPPGWRRTWPGRWQPRRRYRSSGCPWKQGRCAEWMHFFPPCRCPAVSPWPAWPSASRGRSMRRSWRRRSWRSRMQRCVPAWRLCVPRGGLKIMRRMDFGEPGGIHLACRLLGSGEAMILPTETLYGFSAVATSEAGRQQIAAWKGIESPRSFLALLPCFDALLSYLSPGQDPRVLDFLRRLWPAPLTAVLRVQEAQPWGETVESGATAAFRVPAHLRLRALLARLGA